MVAVAVVAVVVVVAAVVAESQVGGGGDGPGTLEEVAESLHVSHAFLHQRQALPGTAVTWRWAQTSWRFKGMY